MAEKYNDLLQQLDMERLPRHIAIIMDGNGRWATRRCLPRSAGHKAGAEALRRTTELCREIGVEALTVYAFSTENWRRSEEEVSFLMSLLIEYLQKEVALMNQQDIRLGFLGDMNGLPAEVRSALLQALQDTAENKHMTLNLAINYGGRDELCRAARRMAGDVQAGLLQPEKIDEAAFAAYLDTADCPDLDLLIRPSGELRLSNFLLFQCAYSEFYFSDRMWPEFGKRDLLSAILDYQQRDRRFGRA